MTTISHPQSTEAASSARRRVDWESIELDYRAGIKTLRQIADENSITHGAINKRAKRDGWERDLSGKIRAKADALVSRAAVSTEVSRAAEVSERQVVDANAQAITSVRLGQRSDIQRARRIANALLMELEQQSGHENVALLVQLGELMRRPDDKGQDKLNDLYQKIIGLPGRAKTMKDLGESLRVLVGLERVAFGLGEGGDPGDETGGASQLTDVQRASRLATLIEKARRNAGDAD